MAAVLGLIIGVVLGVFVKPDIPIILQPYLPIMVVAALDALLGAARATSSVASPTRCSSSRSSRTWSPRRCWCSWAISWASIQLQTAVIVVLGIRIFSNVSAIRRFIFRG